MRLEIPYLGSQVDGIPRYWQMTQRRKCSRVGAERIHKKEEIWVHCTVTRSLQGMAVECEDKTGQWVCYGLIWRNPRDGRKESGNHLLESKSSVATGIPGSKFFWVSETDREDEQREKKQGCPGNGICMYFYFCSWGLVDFVVSIFLFLSLDSLKPIYHNTLNHYGTVI